ncbi:MAG TPA: OmpA family protein [Steroidobacteraceae bacterium]|nr:OmpA family protein [Steroidobacteraceae bacterium]
MNTLTNNLRAGVVGLAAAVVCVTTLPVRAEQVASKPEAASKQENIGVVSGLAVGAVAGGPVGALFGAAAGAWLGDRYHKQAVAQKGLTADLKKTEGERAQLAGNVSELNGSLARAHDRGEQLTQVVTRTDQVETDVGFRTNDASVSEQSMSPLLKLGALAAAMPDAKVRVSGYADPRGSDELNDALSKRRADAVAAVLATAGLPPDRMIVEAHGKADSTSPEGDLDGYAFERRVTVRIEHVASDSVASR